MNNHPNRAKCYQMLEVAKTPAHIVSHCKAVAAVAYTIGWEINRARRIQTGMGCRALSAGAVAGRVMNLDLLLSSGLIHDMMRLYDNHAKVCADLLDKMGLVEEAKVVSVHMVKAEFHDLMIADEADILCLADNMVIESEYVGLDRRTEYVLEKAIRIGHPERQPAIRAKRDNIQKLITQIERLVGKSMDDIMVNIDYENVENILTKIV